MKKATLIITATAGLIMGCAQNKTQEKKQGDTPSETTYKVVPVQQAGLHQTVNLPAQLAAYQEVSIFPKVNGYVKSVMVDIGSHVKAGQLLMTLDAPEIQQQVLQAKERYARSRSDYNIDKENYLRLKVASKTAGAISPMDLATSRAKMEADSSLSNAEKANWQMQQTTLDYLIVKAPFDGVITDRNIHPGALVSAEGKDSKPMLELKQVNHLRLQVDVPETIAALLTQNDAVKFSLSAFPGKETTAKVSRKAGNVNVQYRTEKVEMDVANPDGTMAPGMYANVSFNDRGNIRALSVPKTAVITSTERKYVIAVRGGKAVKVDVTTGNEDNEAIEVLGTLTKSDRVIANANEEIRDGEKVMW